MAQITYRTIGGEILDGITHKHYRGKQGAAEAVLAANAGLARIGPVLPAGIDIVLPDLPETKPQEINLWD